MSVQFLLSFDACSTSHTVEVPPTLLMILLINVILCLPLARFPIYNTKHNLLTNCKIHGQKKHLTIFMGSKVQMKMSFMVLEI